MEKYTDKLSYKKIDRQLHTYRKIVRHIYVIIERCLGTGILYR